MDLLSTEGLRQDGRSASCMRDMKCRMGLYDKPNGSAFMQMGNTQVLAALYGPKEVIMKLSKCCLYLEYA